MRRKPTQEERLDYLRRITGLEKHLVLPAKAAVVFSCVIFLWPVMAADVWAKELAPFRWAILAYAIVNILYWVYLFRFAPRIQGVALTEGVVFASALTDNALLGFLLYAIMMEPLSTPWLEAAPEASLFWVYCALLVRNTLLFRGPVFQVLVNSLYIFGYVGAVLFNTWGLHKRQLTQPAQRELFFRVIMLSLVTICSSAIYALRQKRLRELDEAHEMTVRSLRLDMARILAAQVAHELKNPLSVMTNAAFLMRRFKPGLDPNFARQLEIIEDEIRRSDRLITELLDYARLAEGRIRAVLVNDSIDQSLDALKHEVESRGIRVDKNYSFDLPYLFIDAGQLRQVFSNILLNACEAIQNGGRIAIGTNYSRDGFIEVTVSDTGRGMPQEVLSNIFKPFFTTKEKGTGMGLAIVQNIVRAYRGEITAESRPGTGTTFRLRFPTRMAVLQREGVAGPVAARDRLESAGTTGQV